MTCTIRIITLLVFPTIVLAQDGPIVAIFSMEDRGSNLGEQIVGNLVDYLAARLAEEGYQVVAQDSIKDALSQQKKESYKHCFDQRCQIEVGRELAAQKTLTTKILRIGNVCQITAVMYDLKRAATETAATAGAACEENKLLEALGSIVDKLSAPLRKAREAAESGLAEFESIKREATSERERSERMRKAWQIVENIAKDEQLPISTRIKALEKFISEFHEESTFLEEAKKLISVLSQGSVNIVTSPSGADVFIDGKKVGQSPLEISLTEGTHPVEISADNHKKYSGSIEVTRGKKQQFSITLELEGEANPAPLKEPTLATLINNKDSIDNIPESTIQKPLDKKHGADHKKLWGHVTLWSGVGFLALGGVAAGMAVKASSDFEAGDHGAYDTSRMWTGIMWGSLAVGSAAVTTGLIVLFYPWGKEKQISFFPTMEITGETIEATVSWRW